MSFIDTAREWLSRGTRFDPRGVRRIVIEYEPGEEWDDIPPEVAITVIVGTESGETTATWRLRGEDAKADWDAVLSAAIEAMRERFS